MNYDESANQTPVVPQQATHRHKKRGTEYVLIGYAKMQAEKWRDLSDQDLMDGCEIGDPVDMREVAVYRSVTNPAEIWVRPREEFEDGRFEQLTTMNGLI